MDTFRIESITSCQEVNYNLIFGTNMKTVISNIPINDFGHAILKGVKLIDVQNKEAILKNDPTLLRLIHNDLKLVIDTGASITSIKSSLINVDDFPNRITESLYHSSDGLKKCSTIHNIALEIQNHKIVLSSLNLIELEDPEYDGYIGWDVLRYSTLVFEGYQDDYLPKKEATMTIFKR